MEFKSCFYGEKSFYLYFLASCNGDDEIIFDFVNDNINFVSNASSLVCQSHGWV